MSNTQKFLKGVKAGFPVIIGYIPVAIAYAIIAKDAGLSIGETVFMSISVYGGASQMMASGLIKQGATMFTIVVTTFILNLRHLIMSTVVNERMKNDNKTFRSVASYWVTDESFAVFSTSEESNANVYFFFGLAISTYLSWVSGSYIGYVAASLLPESLSVAFGVSLYAMFVGLLFPALPHNKSLVKLVILTAIVNCVLSQFMISSWALIVSTLVCAFAGVFFVDLD